MPIQVIGAGNPKRSFSEKLNAGMGKATELLESGRREWEKQKFAEREQENLARFMNEEYGLNTQHLPQDFQKEILKGEYAQGRRNQTPQQLQQDQERYNIIKEQWGDEAANLYKSAPEGGKTELIKQFVDMSQRGLDVRNTLKTMQGPSKTPGYTPKEETRLGEKRYAQNLPLYQERQTKLKGYEDEETALGIIDELSPQISGLTRLNLNPQSGDLLVPALASPEAQRYVKTINDWTTKAKDSYGSRVTNFDLTQFMKRLPTLANSEEGRRLIIEQMRTLNAINQARESALINYVDEQGGVRNVDWDVAEREADKRSKGRVDELKKEFTKIESRSGQDYKKIINTDRSLANKKGMVLMELNGENIFVPKSDVAKAKKKGAKAL